MNRHAASLPPSISNVKWTPAVREIPLIQRMVGMVGKGRMVDLDDLRVCSKEFDRLPGVFRVAFETQRKRLGAFAAAKTH